LKQKRNRRYLARRRFLLAQPPIHDAQLTLRPEAAPARLNTPIRHHAADAAHRLRKEKKEPLNIDEDARQAPARSSPAGAATASPRRFYHGDGPPPAPDSH